MSGSGEEDEQPLQQQDAGQPAKESTDKSQSDISEGKDRIESLRTLLRQRKGVLTRYYGKARRQVAERQGPSALRKTLESARWTFDEVECAHDELLSYYDPNSNDYTAREEWFSEVEDDYVKFVNDCIANIECERVNEDDGVNVAHDIKPDLPRDIPVAHKASPHVPSNAQVNEIEGVHNAPLHAHINELPEKVPSIDQRLNAEAHFIATAASNRTSANAPMPNDVNALSKAVSALYLPHTEIDKFSGDPLEFMTFRNAFDSRIYHQAGSDADRLHYLYQLLEGEAKDLVRGAMHMLPTEGFQYATSVLYREYGSPHIVCNAYLQRFTALQPIRNDDAVSLKRLYLLVNQCLCAMKSISGLSVLNFPTNLQTIVVKLPAFLQNRWRNKVAYLHLEGKTPEFHELVDFLRLATAAASDPIFGKDALSGKGASDKVTSHKEKSFSVNVDAIKRKELKCWFCQSPHHLDDCSSFRGKPLKERKQFIQSKKLCFACLGVGHFSRDCRKRRKCGICANAHPTSLHQDQTRDLTSDSTSTDSVSVQSNSCHDSDDNCVMHAVLPVRVSYEGKTIVSYAFYDNGSSASFISEALANELNAQGPTVALRLTTMHGINANESKLIKGVTVCGIEGQNPIEISKMYTRGEIPVGLGHIPNSSKLRNDSKLSKFAHLVPDVIPGVNVGLLIGANCPKALEPLKVLPSMNGPFASLLRHGWTVHGPEGSRDDVSCHRIGVEFIQEIPTPELLSSISEFNDDSYSDIRKYSQNDHLFLQKVEERTAFLDGHYEVPMPLRDTGTLLPCNKALAFQRSHALAKRFDDEQYRAEYTAFMDSMFSKGYAEEVTERGVSGKTWYLPHHGVRHPKKQKLRVVFDCSACYKGLSLNSQLLQGPNLTSSLLGVLTRFREGSVCFVGDIESMFYQVRVPERDRDLLRFLWWPNGDVTGPMKEYRMTVHIFGATSSPSVCNYALRRISEDFECSSQVSVTIQKHFYVDDCLRASDSANEASDLIKDLRSTCLSGGFRIHKFVSNSPAVLNTIPSLELAKGIQDLDFIHEPLPADRALGMKWLIESDEFGFDFTPKDKPMTRRGLLAVVSSVYDPLGIISPVVLPARLLLQEACRLSLAWDDELPEQVMQVFSRWLDFLPKITEVRVQRWLAPLSLNDHIEKQLHVFADASAEAYGAVAYMRLSACDSDEVQCHFLMGKSRVRPLRPAAVSIPRMELTAAFLAAKIGSALSRELSFQGAIFYHTDSTSVLYFLSSPDKRYPIFVANRVHLILDLTSVSQWRHVPSHANPADLASRGVCASLDFLPMWLHGPDFLRGEECTWPRSPCVLPEPSVNALCTKVNEQDDSFDALLSYFSDWMKLKKCLCVFWRFMELLKYRVANKGQALQFQQFNEPIVTLSSLQRSETTIVKYIQAKHFHKEINNLRQLKSVSAQSPVYRLDIFERNGVLRVGGRLRLSDLHPNITNPILLPRNCHVTNLIICDFHERLQHAGRNHVLSSLRERYWIVHGNAAVRHVIWKCTICRKRRRPVENQKMADLPTERVSENPPFTNVGVDLFGPFLVKLGRKEIKRYGVLFTCLTCRAIHVEVAASLDTSSFINALRRFIARRGQVQSISCDNGTNLVGAERELYKSIRESDDQIRRILMSAEIEWLFNPPYASHAGGVWERQIRSVRSVLSNLLREFGKQLDDESLHTLLCEAESIVNSRPLTVLSGDTSDCLPLSPSQLLTMKPSHALLPPGDFSDSHSLYARKRWRRVQYLADLFWSRWKREYVNLLQPRQKWNSQRRSLCVGDVVLLVDESIPRAQWCLCRVVETKQGDDGLTRSVVVKNQSSTLRRSVHKCVLILPVEEQ